MNKTRAREVFTEYGKKAILKYVKPGPPSEASLFLESFFKKTY